MICSNEDSETSIDSLSKKTKFECDDEEMTEVLNFEVEMPRSSYAIGLHSISMIPKDSQTNSYISRSDWHCGICTLEDDFSNMLAMITSTFIYQIRFLSWTK